MAVEAETVLEAVAIGEPAQTAEAENWGMYPSFIQLRIKEDIAKKTGMSAGELGAAVASYAENNYNNAAYSLLAGVFGRGEESGETQCAHLIAAPYAHFGITVSSRKFPATPRSLLESNAFEIIQYRGFDPSKIP